MIEVDWILRKYVLFSLWPSGNGCGGALAHLWSLLVNCLTVSVITSGCSWIELMQLHHSYAGPCRHQSNSKVNSSLSMLQSDWNVVASSNQQKRNSGHLDRISLVPTWAAFTIPFCFVFFLCVRVCVFLELTITATSSMIGRSGTAVPMCSCSVAREGITGRFETAEPKVEHTPEALAEPYSSGKFRDILKWEMSVTVIFFLLGFWKK